MPAASNFSLYSLSKISWKISLNVWSYFLEIVSLVANQRSCFVSSAKLKAGSCEAGDTCVYVVKSLNDAVRTAELVDKLSCFVSVLIGHNKLCCTAVGNLHLGVFVNIAVSVTCNGYRLFFQPGSRGVIPFTIMGALNTVPSRIARIVPLGDFHISFKLYSVKFSVRWE